jgi:hypothetical protein
MRDLQAPTMGNRPPDTPHGKSTKTVRPRQDHEGSSQTPRGAIGRFADAAEVKINQDVRDQLVRIGI